ncbi:uncharacterized protein LOC111042578 isoform X1 [Myzus persicae]|uniref:uncharacterized protein LOC111042578 isoform X1 n=1 Tax=Myzus persicae TaxID=13164 RepID=UPI000B9367A4|nr:uncharacterized protein LOC111042578 isoform X1 [Myzus persicae]
MKTLLVFNILIALLYICTLVSLLTAAGIGETSCRYLGETEKDGQKCRADKVKVHKLPPKCTSFVYNGVMVTSDYNIQYKDDKDDMAGRVCLYDLVHFDKQAKNVYLFFSHGITRDWHHMLINGDYTIVSRKVRIVRNKYYVKGLILDGFHYAYENAVGDMYQNLTDYVKAIKHFDAKLEIGLYLSANTFIKYESKVECIDKDDDWYQPPCNKPYFDFSKMNSIMDFYIIEFHTLNKCITDLLRTGITPLDSSNPHIFSLNYFAALLANSTIDKQKLYFEFLISPIPLTNEIGNFPNCEISYNEYCENKNNKKSKFCADDSEALYQKGKFTKANAKGFIGMYIDLVDRDNKCHCGKYMAFDMMVKRYNGETDPKDCEPLRGS